MVTRSEKGECGGQAAWEHEKKVFSARIKDQDKQLDKFRKLQDLLKQQENEELQYRQVQLLLLRCQTDGLVQSLGDGLVSLKRMLLELESSVKEMQWDSRTQWSLVELRPRTLDGYITSRG